MVKDSAVKKKKITATPGFFKTKSLGLKLPDELINIQKDSQLR
jgi:hypothetical protein